MQLVHVYVIVKCRCWRQILSQFSKGWRCNRGPTSLARTCSNWMLTPQRKESVESRFPLLSLGQLSPESSMQKDFGTLNSNGHTLHSTTYDGLHCGFCDRPAIPYRAIAELGKNRVSFHEWMSLWMDGPLQRLLDVSSRLNLPFSSSTRNLLSNPTARSCVGRNPEY